MIIFYLNSTEKPIQNNITVFQKFNTYYLEYPCLDSFTCYNYFADFPRGKYLIELYGASGGSRNNIISSAFLQADRSSCIDQKLVELYGGNTKCNKISSVSGAGGYTAGYIFLREKTRVYISIGGAGEYKIGEKSWDDSNRAKGGYNGGGRSFQYFDGTSSGGGATDIRLEKDDFWHRIMVAGGGGGADNEPGTFRGSDDGTAGAGGGLIAQGYWSGSNYYSSLCANQTFGFTFGNGEDAQQNGSKNPNGIFPGFGAQDRPGAGGGWYGGFTGQNGDGGSGGGSSFAFTEDAIIPEGKIESRDGNYENPEEHEYAFSKNLHKRYLVTDPIFFQGIWAGNGKAVITYINEKSSCTKNYKFNINFQPLLFVSIIIK